MSDSHGHMARPGYRADIDGLRAVAVLSVVGFHAFPRWITGGYTGVDVFFVISGFLISTILVESLAQDRFSFAGFYGRRVRRIFPALVLVLAAVFAFGWLTLLPDEFRQLGRHIAGGAGFVANFVLWGESGYFDSAAALKPLLHLWSLGIEEQYYIAWPLLLWLAWKARLNLLAVTLVLGLVSFAWNIATVGGDAIAAFYSPQTRMWELMAGSALACLALRKPFSASAAMRNAQSLLGAALIAAGVLALTKETRFPGWWGLIPIGGATLVIAAGPKAWLNRAVLSNKALVWVGLISYPLYLWHWPLLCYAHIVEGGTPSPAIRIAAVAIAIVLSWLTYRLVEKPIRSGKFGRAGNFGLAVSMIAVGLAGYWSYAKDGLAFRFPAVVQELAQYKYDHRAGFREGTCFLDPEQEYAAFDACESRAADAAKPQLLLWGDSHAAQLYPGYEETFAGRYRIVQRTASGCPPILGLVNPVRPHCTDINDRIFAAIEKDRPARIVLAANWGIYDWKRVEQTIAKLHAIGITNIDFVGPVPQWTDNLPRQLYLAFKADPLHRMPERMNSGLQAYFLGLDPILADFSKRTGVNYLSPMQELCNAAGCLTRLGNTGDTLTAWDDQHLTATSSRFVVSRLAKP